MIWPICSIYFRFSVCESGMIRKGQYFSGEWLKQRFLDTVSPSPWAVFDCSRWYSAIYGGLSSWMNWEFLSTNHCCWNQYFSYVSWSCLWSKDFTVQQLLWASDHWWLLSIDWIYLELKQQIPIAVAFAMSISWCILHCFVASFTYSRPISGKFRCIFICFFSLASPWPCWGACKTFITDRGRPQVVHGMKMNKYIYIQMFLSAIHT
jgi:hypothetical protein